MITHKYKKNHNNSKTVKCRTMKGSGKGSSGRFKLAEVKRKIRESKAAPPTSNASPTKLHHTEPHKTEPHTHTHEKYVTSIDPESGKLFVKIPFAPGEGITPEERAKLAKKAIRTSLPTNEFNTAHQNFKLQQQLLADAAISGNRQHILGLEGPRYDSLNSKERTTSSSNESGLQYFQLGNEKRANPDSVTEEKFTPFSNYSTFARNPNKENIQSPSYYSEIQYPTGQKSPYALPYGENFLYETVPLTLAQKTYFENLPETLTPEQNNYFKNLPQTLTLAQQNYFEKLSETLTPEQIQATYHAFITPNYTTFRG